MAFFVNGNVTFLVGAYWKSVAQKYDVPRYTKLLHEVVSVIYDEAGGMWDLQVRDLVTGEIFLDRANVVLQAVGE